MRWLLLVAICGCKFTPGAYARDGAIELEDDATDLDAAADTSADATETTCNSRWRNGTIRFGTPAILSSINSTAFDRDPFLAPDELTMWVSSGRAGGTGGTVWIAKRSVATGPFDPAQVDTSFDSAGNETKLSMTADGLYAVVGSDRTGSAQVDVWEASRPTVDDNWSTMTRTHTMAVNTAVADHDPTVSADGLRLYVAPASGTQHISVATRADRTSNFSAPVELTELTSGSGDADPSPTPDEQILLFASNRPGVVSDPMPPNVYYATRASSTGAFDPPMIVPDINSDMPEGDPHLSTDGCRIYFARDIGTNFEIFVATALP
jgi:hypothetical protein